jgi:hypothetical protein
MFRSTLIAAGAVLLCSAAYSQQTIDPSRIYPITSPPKDAGSINWKTKVWTPANQGGVLEAGTVKIYDNTCTWAVAGYYGGLAACEDLYDEGRVPSSATGPRGTKGATDDNDVSAFQIGYCTSALDPAPIGGADSTVDMEFGFWNNLGLCNAGVTKNNLPAPTAFFAFPAGSGLPGSTTGALACWLVTITGITGFCLESDGNGVWENDQNADTFNWSFAHNNPAPAATPNGFIISGEPATGAVGACTYRIPCGTDALYGNPCGSGLDTWDGFWINVDGVGVGVTNDPDCTADVGPIAGTNCYFFGGYPANPFASAWLTLESRGDCDGCTGNITSYCTSKTNSLGCLPTIVASGAAPSAGRNTAAFFLRTNQALPGKVGILFYGINGRNGAPFQGGHLCVLPPTKRTPLQTSTSTGAPPCTGVFSFNFNAHIQSGTDPELNYGRTVNAQYWTRDNGVPSGTSLTNGIEFTICL